MQATTATRHQQGQDLTLQELRIETLFPADSRSEDAWMRLTAPPEEA